MNSPDLQRVHFKQHKEVLEENENALVLSSLSWGRPEKAAGGGDERRSGLGKIPRKSFS